MSSITIQATESGTMKQKCNIIRRIISFLLFFIASMLLGSSISFAQVRYPVHGTVQVLPPYGLYLSDYYGGSQDRLVVTLLNRDLEQPLLQARLRVRVKNGMNFSLESRDEIVYPILELSPNVPLRLTSIDIAPYLQPDHIRLSGRLDNGRLPVGMTEFSVQVVEYHTGRPLSAWHTGRAWLDIKNPPILNYPRPNEVIPYHEPFTQVQFQWMPRHQGVSGTEYEFVLKELPDNGVAPQSAFAYGIEIYRTRQRQTRLTYSVMEPLLEKNKRYGWQVRAVAVSGIDEIGMFANNGFTEIGWFEVRETVPAPTGLTGNAGYGKVDLKWSGSPNHQGYIIQYHPITAGDEEWIEARSYDTFSTLNGMKLGVKYEIRVGAYGSAQRPIYCSPIEVTIPSVNESRLAECGKGLNLPERIQEPITNLQVGDTITIGPDFKMVATELHALGDGWYSGKGSTLLTWIFESRIAVHFDRLRVNVQREQIDGEVFTDYDDTESQIANSDRIDDGGSGTHRVEIEVPTTSVDFVMPDMPEGSTYDATTGSLTIYDTNGEVHNVPIPKNESGEPTFPMLIKDATGQTYEVSEPDESTSKGETSDDSTGRTDDRKKKGPRPVQIKKVEQITDFNREGLNSNLRLTFSGDGSRYAFDDGKEVWYKSAVKLDSYYKSLDKNGYIAPWKLIPVGEKDVVKVRCSDSSLDATTVRFVLENGDIVPANYDNTNREWRLELPSVESGEEYAVYGLVEGKTAGKLRVISYQKQRHEVTLVQTNDYAPDAKTIERELNAIYSPIGIAFTVHTDTLFSKSWDLNGDGLLSIEGKTLFGKSVDVKESKEMRALQRLYTSTTKREGICIFSMDGEQGVHKSGSLLGEMPRNSRFGYVFTSGSPDVKQLAHTIAHELGHGLFTLQHTFDDEYGGTKSQGTTDNLMDYGTGDDLVVFQWNIMSKPAIFTALDNVDDVVEKGDSLKILLSELYELGDDHILFATECAEKYSSDGISYVIDGMKYYIIKLNSTVDAPPIVVERKQDRSTYSKKSNIVIGPIPKQGCFIIQNAGDGDDPEPSICPIEDHLRYPGACSYSTFIKIKGLKEKLLEDISKCADKAFNDIVKEVHAKVLNPFFSDVKMDVTIASFGGANVSTISSYDSGMSADIKLNIQLKENGGIDFTVKASDSYLEDNVVSLQREADARGISVKVEELREQVIQHLESIETNKTLFDKVAQKLESIFSKQVGAFVESIQATQKITKHVWEHGNIHKSTWYSKDIEYNQWPEYMKFEPLIGGVADGAIGEIVGIPLAVKGVYEIISDKSQREAFASLFTKDGIRAMAQSLKSEAQNISSDEELLTHLISQTTIEVASFATGGGIIVKGGKLSATAKEASRVVSDFPSSVQACLKRIKDGEKFNPNTLKALEEYLGNIDPKMLEKLSDVEGFDKVLSDMAVQWKKFSGGKFQLEYFAKLLDESNVISMKFEVPMKILVDGKEVSRVYDGMLKTTQRTVRFELKSWSQWYPETIRKQFIRDIQAIQNLEELKWVFHKTSGVNKENLKERILSTLKKADGTPVDEINLICDDPISLNKIRKTFGDDNIEDAKSLLRKLENDKIFNTIFNVVE